MTSLLKSLTDGALIDYALTCGLNFALFRLPGHTHAHIYVSDTILSGEAALSSHGLVTATFSNDRVYNIPPSYERTHTIKNDNPTEARLSQTDFPSVQKWYKEGLEYVIRYLKQHGGKTVIAATRQAEYNASVIEIFDRLALAYPNAFIYTWHIASAPEIWIGATPELLLSLDDTCLHTMSLAGTRPSCTDIIGWDDKNIAEQALVTDFIVATLNHHNTHPEVSAPRTLKAGHIEHICTDINAKLDVNIDVYSLLQSLAPTPAVCGFPKAVAMRQIKDIEPFNREFYGGYCGLVESSLKLQLYVTLRCMSLLPVSHRATLYAGGGITARSVSDDEWREVNYKMHTLASALGDRLHFYAEKPET